MFSASNTILRAMNYYIPKRNKIDYRKIPLFGMKKNYFGDGQFYRNVYLKSDHWKNLKEEKLKQSPSCQICGIKNFLDVHHVSYKNLYDVELRDLRTLCRAHHSIEHKKFNELRKIKIREYNKKIDKREKRRLVRRKNYKFLCIEERRKIKKDNLKYRNLV